MGAFSDAIALGTESVIEELPTEDERQRVPVFDQTRARRSGMSAAEAALRAAEFRALVLAAACHVGRIGFPPRARSVSRIWS